MKKNLLLFTLIVSIAIFAQNPGEIWYLETVNYEEISFDEEVPEVVAQFGVDEESRIILETSVCGSLKAWVEFTMCGCNEFGVVEILDYNEESCINPENSQLQQNYFSAFLENDGYYPAFGYQTENLENGVERLTLYSNNDVRLTFLSERLSVSDVGFEDEIEIYPNPVRNVLNFSEEVKDIEIFTLSGQKVLTCEKASELNLNQLDKGFYLIKFKTKYAAQKSMKFLKQ